MLEKSPKTFRSFLRNFKLSFLSNTFFISYSFKVQKKYFELKDILNKYTTNFDRKKLPLIKDLINQEGKIDYEIEGYKSTKNQRPTSYKFAWGHNHNFGEIEVEGVLRDRHITLMAEFIVGFKLQKSFFLNKSFIDIGSWTGGTTLMLKSLGAKNILSIEEVKKYSMTANKLLGDIYGEKDVTFFGDSIFRLNDVKEKYDIAYYPGVIYHVSDPVLSLRILFNSLKDEGVILVESMGTDSRKAISFFNHNTDLSNWFCPSPKCLKNWMKRAGFVEVKTFYSYKTGRVFGFGRRKKYEPIKRSGFARADVD